ncbi:competence protein CoiA family protein [Vibrio breoganii]|uniref:competence protein CoiA family protein n=1 Tax=Vibrio breoganii TaxID=553239 RepID=UPI000C85570D|nr:competence protein CoiA family protein [Vibrio breoganii]PMK56790.1 hypothetical protein BCT98_09150 [Vibrio breoganii]
MDIVRTLRLVRMAHAIDGNGVIVNIHEVANGRSCNCFCVTCNQPVVAKQGALNAWSFAHDSNVACKWSGETELHLLAKEVIRDEKKIRFRHVTLDNQEHYIEVEFIEVREEEFDGLYRPDLLGITAHGERFCIEVCVSHKCDEDKVRFYRERRENLIEINLPTDVPNLVESLDRRIVKSLLNQASTHCLSLNPLSEFTKELSEANHKHISRQGEQLRQLANDISDQRHQSNALNHSISKLSKLYGKWNEHKNKVENKAKRYEKKLLKEIESQQEITKYKNQLKELIENVVSLQQEKKLLTDDIERGLSNYRNTRLAEIEKSLLSQASQLRAEVETLESIQLLLRTDEKVVEVDDAVQIIKLHYEDLFDQLKRDLMVVRRVKPDFEIPKSIANDCRTLPHLTKNQLRTYKDIKG